jgi:hypothetical protein
VATLLMIAVITGAAVAFFQSTRIERFVSRNYADLARAQLAAESGYALAAALIRAGSTNDNFLVVQNTNRQLYFGNGTNQTAPNTFAYLPLFSFTNNPNEFTTNNSIVTDTNPTTNVSGSITFTNTLPGGLTATSPAVSWVILTNSAGRTNARFAFWVEDLSGRLDVSVAGSTGTNARRPTGTNPAELALWSLFNPNVTNDPDHPVVSSLVESRRAILTPATARLVNAAVTTNLLADLAANLIHDTNEPEIIPYGFGYADRGLPKYNLQTYGTNTTNGATNLLSIITNNLNSFGGFASRSGGMNGTRYLHALAANIQDYIDTDINPTTNTIGGGPVRGVEPLPFVTETATSIWWYDHGTNIPGFVGNIADEIHLANYVELWNPSDRAFSGNVTVSFSNNYACGSVNTIPIELTITTSSATRRWTNTLGTTHPHTNVISVNPPLEPNEYRVFFLGTNIYRFRILGAPTPEGPWYNGNRANAGGFLRLGQPAAGTADSFASTLSLSYNGFVYDRAVNIHRVGNRTIYCRPFATTAERRNPDWAGNVPALRMFPTESPALPGDSRIGFYLTGTNNAQGYATTPANPGSSMGFRNRGISSGGTRYETTPNLWLDGGHANSPLQNGTVTDSNFPSTARQTTAFTNEYVQKFNNTGIWSNIFELGNIFDPMAWNVRTNDIHISSATTSAGNGSTVLTNGGGTTLRIGRAEHGRFTSNGLRASQLLDLFALNTNSAVTVITNRVAGRINLNTATPNVLRALAAGVVHARDPALTPGSTNFTIPVAAVTNFVAGVTNFRNARPFYSPAQLTQITNGNNYPADAVFGNRTNAGVTAWNDLAAEEWFSKIYPLATVRSRNFLVHVVGQAMTTNTNFASRPVATSRQVYQIYAEPQRNASGLTTNVNVRKLTAWTL